MAAIRMHEHGYPLLLATISSWHLFGIDRVRERLRELKSRLPLDTPWIRLYQPEQLNADTPLYEHTCLPCHHAYTAVGAAIASKIGVAKLGFGYASYQGTWPEQTPLAVTRLSAVLARYGIELLLPVYDLVSRQQVVQELEMRGLSTAALEQKCVQQITNIKLSDVRLAEQIALWESAIDASLSAISTVQIDVAEVGTLGGM
jgi:hypothetical protein